MVPGIAILFLMASDLFSLVFGSNWRHSGVMISILCPMFMVQFITFPLSGVMILLWRDKDRFVFQVTMLCLRIIALTLGAKHAGYVGALVAFSAVSSFCYIVYLRHILRQCGIKISALFSSYASTFGITCVCALPLVLLKLTTPDTNLAIALWALGLLTLSIYYLYLVRTLMEHF